MRPQNALRPVLAAGVLGFGSTWIANGPLAAHAAGDAGAAPATSHSQAVAFGQPVVLQGRLVSGVAGQHLELDYQAAGASVWQPVASSTSQAGGAWRLSAPVQRSGRLRTRISGAAQTASDAGTQVSVAAGLSGAPRVHNLLAGRSDRVLGTIQPAVANRALTLQARVGRGWSTVAHARTTASGHYSLRFKARRTGSFVLRVGFAGDQLNAASRHTVGVVNVYRPAGASWYGPGGSLACGGSLSDSTQGVAHKTLPCGTLVTLRHGSRTVRVPVIDRGPYVAGRDYDLAPATKRALRFGDTGTVWATR